MKAINRIGLTIVHEPVGGHNVDIVLVHGLFGHPENTWSADLGHNRDTSEPPLKRLKETKKQSNDRIFWPRDLLPLRIPTARIMTWGYDVSINNFLSSSSKASIYQHSETLLCDLSAARTSAFDRDKPIIFIAHSLGGIVVKDALQLSAKEKSYLSEIANGTTGVMFLGTPHHGSKAASLGKLAFNAAKILLQDANTKILEGLEINSEILERVSRGFGQLLATGGIRVHSFREELSTKGMMIVDSFSSTIGYFKETRGSLHANHREMAKFTSKEDVKFLRVSALLERWVVSGHEDTTCPPVATSEVHAIPYSLIFEEQYRECLQSLNSVDARRRFDEVDPVHEETFHWIFKGGIGFQDWLRGLADEPIHWIQGKPGSGKSTAMKYAMMHPSTLRLLGEYHPHKWIIAGYFFHDRGTKIQKTCEGMLGEILHEILKCREDLFYLVLPIYSRLANTPSTDNPKGDKWQLKALEEALLTIGKDTDVDVNLCVFIDALDEHEGDHRKLISTLNGLRKLTVNKLFRLRLCVAGRPEGTFKSAYQHHPGFEIQDHSASDIKIYAESRLRHEMTGELSQESNSQLNDLIRDVTKRAQGVFLWVRLVVDEMVEGLCEGDTIDELKDLLSTIPSELSDLYSRALRRPRRKSFHVTSKNRLEAYVMFQLAIQAVDRFTLGEFLAATDYLAKGQACSLLPMELSDRQMERRLYSRSLGLLEVQSAWKYSRVQFIHQTVKEFMNTGEGFQCIREGLEHDDLDTGPTLMLKYLSGLIEFSVAAPDYVFYSEFLLINLISHAHKYEKHESGSAAEFLEPTLQLLGEQDRHELFKKVIDSAGGSPCSDLVDASKSQPTAHMLIFYTFCRLRRSMRYQASKLNLDLTESDRRQLLRHIAVLEVDAAVRGELLPARIASFNAAHVPSFSIAEETVDGMIECEMYKKSESLFCHPNNLDLVDWLDCLISSVGNIHPITSGESSRMASSYGYTDLDEQTDED